MTVVVVGVGLAGVTAALSAKAAGADVVLVADRPGGTALWSGVAEVYGPIYDRVDYQDPLHRPHLVTVGQPPLEDRAARLTRLLRRRSFHPYARLDLSLRDLDEVVSRASEALDVGLFWAPEPLYVANAHGTVRLADGAWPSLSAGALLAERRYCVVAFEHYPAFDADAAAQALESQGLRAGAAWIDAGTALAQSPAVASARLEALDDEALVALGGELARATAGAVALLPPILGRSPRAHRRLLDRLAEGAGDTAFGEVAGVTRSLPGFRLQLALEARLEAAGVRRVRDRVAEVELGTSRVASTVVTRSGERIAVDAVVLATGRAVGGGIRRESPLAETIVGLPLFIEGAPLEAAQYPPQLATRRLFDDHPLFRIGVGVSPGLQPLGADARPAFENVFAAGLLIGGTDFTRDGSAFGVGLVTGWLAGRRAAGVGD